MECEKKFTNPRNERIYETFVGTGQALMASTLSLAMWTHCHQPCAQETSCIPERMNTFTVLDKTYFISAIQIQSANAYRCSW